MSSKLIPGFGLTLGTTVLYLALIVILPLSALLLKAADIGVADFITILTNPRTWASMRVTLLTAAYATLFNVVYGFALAWVLARYSFSGKRLLDALVDLPFALPTAVAGLAISALYSKNSWLGAALDDIGISVVYTPLGIAVAMAFTSLPFVVRTLQPVIQDLGTDMEEAARSLGASEFRTFRSVILPSITPALIAGATLAFSRSIGEFGAVIFIAGNQPMRTEIITLLTFIRLQEFDYPAAAVLATTMLALSFTLLIATNYIQQWHLHYVGRGE